MKQLTNTRKLWPFIKPYLWPIFFSTLLGIPIAAIASGLAFLTNYFNDNVLVKKDLHALELLAVVLPIAFVLNFLLRFLNMFLIRSAANRMTQQLRNKMFDHLLRLSVGYFNSAQMGVLLNRVTYDVQVIVKAVSNFADLVREPLTLAGLLGYAFYLNWKLTLVTLLIVPACAILLSNAGRHSKRYSNRILEKLGAMSALLSESVGGIRVIQAFRLEAQLAGKFRQLNREFTVTSNKSIRMEELSRPSVELVFGLGMTFLIFFASREVLQGHMTPGGVVGFLVCWGAMLAPLKKLSDLNISLHQSAAAVDNIFAILDRTPDVKDPPHPRTAKPFASEIEFRNVTFAYDQDPVLKNFSLKIKKGEVVALVGMSGAGKSTLLNLIPRFFDPQEGAVLLDGVDVRDLSLQSLRQQVALVTQEVFLFHDTIRANIRVGRHNVPDEAVRAAAEAAQAWAFIERLPQGLGAVVGDRGQKLSGGERQRLSIARAILKDAPILLLDEATSALDSENERLVQAALDRLLVGRTALVVAHRLSTIRKASRILVIGEGRILEEGDHESLVARGGAYAKALSHQSGLSET